MSEVAVSINASFGKEASKRVEGLENKVKASMLAVLANDWMGSPEHDLFAAAIAGALLDVGFDTEYGNKIIETTKAIRKLNAFINASQAGLNVSADSLIPDDDSKLIPLNRWWIEVKEEYENSRQQRDS